MYITLYTSPYVPDPIFCISSYSSCGFLLEISPAIIWITVLAYIITFDTIIICVRINNNREFTFIFVNRPLDKGNYILNNKKAYRLSG